MEEGRLFHNELQLVFLKDVLSNVLRIKELKLKHKLILLIADEMVVNYPDEI